LVDSHRVLADESESRPHGQLSFEDGSRIDKDRRLGIESPADEFPERRKDRLKKLVVVGTDRVTGRRRARAGLRGRGRSIVHRDDDGAHRSIEE